MLYKNIIRPALFALGNGDAEEAHNIVKGWMKTAQRIPPLLYAIDFLSQAYYNEKPVEAFGIKFPNRVGLAAGFDKNAEVLPFIQALGFGHAEVGAVLPRKQRGNDKPRIFRVPEFEGIINRMGFNSAGVTDVIANLRWHKPKMKIPVGINIGKMKDTLPENAVHDYNNVLLQAYHWIDYSVANVSSPNTPNLRQLQTPKFLGELLSEIVKTSNSLGGKPVLVKFDPDMDDTQTLEAVRAAVESGISGVILTNTTMQRPERGPGYGLDPRLSEAGGMSGEWLFEKSLRKVALVHANFPNLPIIGVGGINSADCWVKMLDAGATLGQIYTGLIYEGPDLVRKLRFLL